MFISIVFVSQLIKISTINNVESVFALFDDDKVDIVLADYRDLPYEADRFIDEFRFYFPNIPCFLMMDKHSPKISEHFKNVGFTDCIPLSTRRNLLADILESSIGREISKGNEEVSSIDEFQVDGSIPFRILLAEDSQANQLVAMNVLESVGYKVDAVANGIEAIKAIQSLPYDVILMDLQMPEMGGIEATEHIRNLPSSIGDVPILAMTANVLGDVRRQCKAAGMNGFISKPINKKELFSRLSVLYDNKKEALLTQKTPLLEHDYMNDKPLESDRAAPESESDLEYISEKILKQLIEDTSISAVQRMASVFETETQKRIDIMLALIETKDWPELKKEAHTLKSSCASYGALALSNLAMQIESDMSQLTDEEINQNIEQYKQLESINKISLEQLRNLLEAEDA